MQGTLNQPYIFLAAIYIGIVSGILYELFIGVRKLCGQTRVFVICADIVYIVFVSLVIFFYLYHICDFEIRYYTFIGMFVGSLMYLVAIRPLISKIYVFFRKLRVDKSLKKRSNRR